MSMFERYVTLFKYSNEDLYTPTFKLRHKLATKPELFTIEDARELDYQYEMLRNKYQRVTRMLTDCLKESHTLEVQNEFMLKLINEHRIAE